MQNWDKSVKLNFCQIGTPFIRPALEYADVKWDDIP